MSLPIQDANHLRMTVEKWIVYEKEGSLIPRGRETPDMIQSHELRDNEIPTLSMAIRVLAYTGRKRIVDPDSIKVQLEWYDVCTH